MYITMHQSSHSFTIGYTTMHFKYYSIKSRSGLWLVYTLFMLNVIPSILSQGKNLIYSMENIKKLDLTIALDDVDASLRLILKDIRPGWSAEDISIQDLNRGLANRIFKCKLKTDKDDKDAINIRVYGSITPTMTGYDYATITRLSVLLYEAKVGPKIYATFTNGMAYEYLAGNALTPKELCEDRNIPTYLANQVATFHSMDPYKLQTQLKEPISFSRFNDPLQRFRHLYRQIPDEDSDVATSDAEWINVKAELSKEAEFIENEFSHEKKYCIDAFCHGDLTIGNMILNNKEDSLKLIDFELSGFGCGLRDIALFIITAVSEMVEGRVSFEKELPKDIQLNILKCYIKTYYEKCEMRYDESKIDWDILYRHVLLESAAMFLTFAALMTLHQEKTMNGIKFKWLVTEDIKIYNRQKKRYLSYK